MDESRLQLAQIQLAALLRAPQAPTKKLFCQQVGISPNFLSEILSGKRFPGRDTIIAIQEATGRQVPAQAWYDPAPTDPEDDGGGVM